LARHRPAVAQVADQQFVHQHVGGLDADPDGARQHAEHGLGRVGRRLSQPLQAGALDVGDLLLDQLQPPHGRVGLQPTGCGFWGEAGHGFCYNLARRLAVAAVHVEPFARMSDAKRPRIAS
jgi:hypothetical protein